MNFNDIIKAGSAAAASYASSLPGTSAVPVSNAYAGGERFLGMSGAQGAGIGLGTIVAGYVIGRWFGVVPKLI